MERLEVQRIAEGLWRWTAPHPEWTPDKGGPAGWDRSVGSVYCETPDGIVLIDPLAPPAGTPEFRSLFDALDRDVERSGRPLAILLANRYHVRSTQAVYERYRSRPGASVWAHAASGVGCTVTRRFVEQDPLPGGLRAFSISGLNAEEVVFHLPAHRALVPADAILGAGGGKLRLAPPDWAEDRARYQERFREELRRLLDLPIERVLVSHGEPVLEGGARALAELLESQT
jgi:glyoxylase-like metal-dependent hydrolase (beta-lactamase superfamily II)